ncbi:hypothetical protein IFM89_000375 [Coptis chinensis]|uniref:DNA helicase n=1 Tax=Coptis chinensis TaxID=261450 RepID=A0A835HBZ7_9MAGN|nr:hypothetical protein IFM89_000375 [Coptis chinensis]
MHQNLLYCGCLSYRLTRHWCLMQLHAGYGESSPAPKKLCRALQVGTNLNIGVKRDSLASKLRLDPQKDREFTPLHGLLLRKYIAYARTFIFPRMTKPAAEILQKFYLQLRDHNNSADGTPITARQLESLVRLAQARARVDLRAEITVQDALSLDELLLCLADVVEIMKESLYDKYVDEHGIVDFGRSGGMSQQKEAKRFLSALNKHSELAQKDCFSISEIYSLADRIGLRVPDIDTFVDNLNSVGYLLKKGPKMYQVVYYPRRIPGVNLQGQVADAHILLNERNLQNQCLLGYFGYSTNTEAILFRLILLVLSLLWVESSILKDDVRIVSLTQLLAGRRPNEFICTDDIMGLILIDTEPVKAGKSNLIYGNM